MEMRPGLRKRSKISPWWSGSTRVISRQYATIEPLPRAAGVVPDALFAGVAAQVPHDQEVGVEAHLVDHLQLVIQALAHDRVIRPLAVAR